MERRGLRYRFYDRLLESLRGSRGYRELFHRVFDLMDFYDVRKFLSVRIGSVSVPSVLKLSQLTLVPKSSQGMHWLLWDWENEGRLTENENDKGLGLTAPFGISTHGYYENTEDGKSYYLYVLNADGSLSVDFDVRSDVSELRPILFVLAPLGTPYLSSDCLEVTEDISNEVFSSCYISFSGATDKSSDILGNFYINNPDYYSISTLTTNPMTDLLSCNKGNSSVARFREECLNRGVNEAWVSHLFNNGGSGSYFHIVPNYVQMRKVSADSSDNHKASVITQDNLMISPGDEWFTDYEFYYEFVLHLGEYDGTNHVPNDWCSDKKVSFNIGFYNSDLPLSSKTVVIDYAKWGDPSLLEDFLLGEGGELEMFTKPPYSMNIILMENSGSTTTRYDVVFRSLVNYNISFEPLKEGIYESPIQGTPSISRYQSYYLFDGLRNFITSESNTGINSMFRIQFNDEATNYYLNPHIENDTLNYGLSFLPGELGINVGQYSDTSGKENLTLYSSPIYPVNWGEFPTMKVYCDYSVAYISLFNIPANDIQSGHSYYRLNQYTLDTVFQDQQYALTLTTDILEVDSNESFLLPNSSCPQVKSFCALMVPYSYNPITEGSLYQYSALENDNIETFFRDFREPDGQVIFDDDYSKRFYKKFISGTYTESEEKPYCFPLGLSNPIQVNTDINPYQFFIGGNSTYLDNYVFQNDFKGNYLYPCNFIGESFFSRIIGVQQNYFNIDESKSAFLWVTLFHEEDGNGRTTISRYLVSDYTEVVEGKHFCPLLVAEEYDSVHDTEYKYYCFYLEDIATQNPRFSDSDYKKTIKDYYRSLEDVWLNPPTDPNMPSENENYFLGNEVAMEFFSRAMSVYYLYTKATSLTEADKFFEYLDSTLNAIVSSNGYHERFFSYQLKGTMNPIFFTYSLFSTLLHSLGGDKFEIGVYSLPADSTVFCGTYSISRSIFLGNGLQLTTQSIDVSSYLHPGSQVSNEYYNGMNVFIYKKEKYPTSSLRYSSVRYNVWDSANSKFLNYIYNNFYDLRDFIYPIRISQNQGVDKSFLLKIRTSSHLNSKYLDSYIDAHYTKTVTSPTDYTFGDRLENITTIPTISPGIRPLLFLKDSNTATDNFSRDSHFRAMLTSIDLSQDAPEYAAVNDFTDYIIESIEIIPLKDYPITGDTAYHDVKPYSRVTNLSAQFEIKLGDAGCSLVSGSSCEGSLFLNQKMPLYRVLQTDDSAISDMLFTSLESYGYVVDGNDNMQLNIIPGYVNADATYLPLVLVDDVQQKRVNENLQVDLLDLSFKPINDSTNQNSSKVLSTLGFESKYVVSQNYLYKMGLTVNVTDGTYPYSSYSYLPNISVFSYDSYSSWQLATLYFNANTSTFEGSTSTMNALLVVDDLIQSGSDYYIPTINAIPPHVYFQGQTLDHNNVNPEHNFKFKIGNSGTGDVYAYLSLPFYTSQQGVYPSIERDRIISTNVPPLDQLTPVNTIQGDLQQPYFYENFINVENLNFGRQHTTDQYTVVSSVSGGDISFHDTIMDFNVSQSTNSDSYTLKALYRDKDGNHHSAIPIATGDTNESTLLYESGDFLDGTGIPTNSQGILHTNILQDSLNITRHHFQLWAPYIGVDPMNLGDYEKLIEDDTTRFILNDHWTQKGEVLSFNGRELYLELTKKMVDGVPTDVTGADTIFDSVESLDRLTIKRNKSWYHWDLTKTLDSFVDFRTERVYEKDGSVVMENFGYVDANTESELTKDETLRYYKQFVPSRVFLGLEDGTESFSLVTGGDASTEETDTLGGGGADI